MPNELSYKVYDVSTHALHLLCIGRVMVLLFPVHVAPATDVQLSHGIHQSEGAYTNDRKQGDNIEIINSIYKRATPGSLVT